MKTFDHGRRWHNERSVLADRARNLRAEIAQTFADADYWNLFVRRAFEAPINPDPDGELESLAARLDRVLGVAN